MGEPTEEARPTPGPLFVGAQNDNLYIIDAPPSPNTDFAWENPNGPNPLAKIYHNGDWKKEKALAELFAAAGTSANKLYERGIDGIAAIEALGEIVEALERSRTTLARAIRSATLDMEVTEQERVDMIESHPAIERIDGALSRIRMEAGDGEE